MNFLRQFIGKTTVSLILHIIASIGKKFLPKAGELPEDELKILTHQYIKWSIASDLVKVVSLLAITILLSIALSNLYWLRFDANLPYPVIFIILALDRNTAFYPDHMKHNSFLGFGTTQYPYSDIQKIEKTLSSITI